MVTQGQLKQTTDQNKLLEDEIRELNRKLKNVVDPNQKLVAEVSCVTGG